MRPGLAAALAITLAACGDPSPEGKGAATASGVLGDWIHEVAAGAGGKIRRAELTFHADGTYLGTDVSWRPGVDPDPTPRRVWGTWQQRGDQIETIATTLDGQPFGPGERPPPVTLVFRDGVLRPLFNGKPVDATFVRR
jgi:hypothetical protein